MWTVGHGKRPLEEFITLLRAVDVDTLVDVRRFPGSRRNPQFSPVPLRDALHDAGIGYLHLEALGGRRTHQPGEDRFTCIRVAGFRSYAAWMASREFQAALPVATRATRPCLMCAETLWWRCHRRLIADLLSAHGFRVEHLMAVGKTQPHRLWPEGEVRGGELFICGERVGRAACDPAGRVR